MNIYYFIEIKNRLLLTTFSWLCCLIINFYYQNNFIYLLVKPSLCYYKETTFYFVYNDLSEPFYTNLQNIVIFSNQIIFFVIVYHFFKFLSPGLYKSEYVMLNFVFKIGLNIMLILFVIFYKYILPLSWEFFINYQNNQKINFFFEAKFNEYMKLIYISYKIISMLTLIGVGLLYLIMVNKNINNFLIKYRKLIYISIVLISSSVTPPDVISQVFLSFGLISFFEIFIYTFIQIKVGSDKS